MKTTDRELFVGLLSDFVPPGSFDAHAHLYDPRHFKGTVPPLFGQNPEPAGYRRYREETSAWMGDLCPSDGLFFPYPARELDVPSANRMVADEVSALPGSRALRLALPGENPDSVEAEVRDLGFSGFKPYHVYAPAPETMQSEACQFVPEWSWEIANRRGLVITLHLVRSAALLDPSNLEYVRDRCARYPDARLVLAHAARGFCARHTVDAVDALRGIDNVFFDSSAICEAAPLEAILRVFGPTRLFFGTDYPISSLRGRCVSVADGFLWIYEGSVDWSRTLPPVQPTLIGLESLSALRQACRTLHLRTGDIELIFGGAIRSVLNGPPHSGESGCAAYRIAKTVIPGGTQLLSKRPEMFAPEQWPAYYAEARGVEVVDVDGRRFIDMTSTGIGACLLGYADPDVNAALVRRVLSGSACTLNSPDEVELAKVLIEIHPWSEMVRFGRAGGEAMAIAVRIARAHTGRDIVAFCGYHGWQDWYLAANLASADGGDPLAGHLLSGLEPAGVPRSLAGTALPFSYNNLDQLEAIIREHGPRLAAIVMEPTRSADPAPGFLEGVRAAADRCGAVLVFDEITSGWRLRLGGAHLRYGVAPDVCVFGKALGNGVPVAAVIGTRNVMQAAQGSFISSTMWTEGLGPAAALACVRKMRQVDVAAHAARIGTRFRDGLSRIALRHGVPVKVTGHPALTYVAFDHHAPAAMGTLFTARMLARGFLAGSGFYPSLAHQDRHVDAFLAAADLVLAEVAEAAAAGDVERRIGGPVRHTGFTRLA